MNRKIIFVILILKFFLLTTYAQSIKFEWVKTAGSVANAEFGKTMVLDSNKSVIVTGGFYNTVDFDAGPGVFNLTSNGNMDMYITEYDSNGVFRWARSIGGTFDESVRDMKLDKQGNLVIIGMFTLTVDFDPGPGISNMTAAFGNTYILKLDNIGNFLWAKQIPVSTSKLDIDVNNNIILGGEFEGTKDFDPDIGIANLTANAFGWADMFMEKLDNNGNFLWVKQIRNTGNSSHQHFGLESDPNGNILFAGNFTSNMDFDPGPSTTILSSAGLDDAFLLKLNATGDFQWVKQFGAGGRDKIIALEVDNNGSVFTTGAFLGVVDFDPSPAVYNLIGSATTRNCFISKLNNNGDFVFAKNFQSGDSFGQALAIDSSNNIYISGGFHTAVDFDPGPGTYILPCGDLFTVKLLPDGSFVWASAYPQPGCAHGDESIYSAIKVDILKNVYFTGSFANTHDFDPGPSIYNVTSSGAWDIYIHKLSQCNNTLSIVNIQSCTGYTLNGITYTIAGVYYQTLLNSVGCDSIIQLNLSKEDILTQQTVIVCDGYIWNGNFLTNSGVYSDTFHLASGCDSISRLNLTITRITTNLNQSACGFYLWDGNLLTNSGTYLDTIRLSSGCDSVVILNLNIKQNPQPYLGKDTVFCKDDIMALSPGSFSSYLWSSGVTNSVYLVADTGTYWVTVTSANFCTATDSIKIGYSDRCYPFFIPTAFTPNNDGLNDYYKPIINIPVSEYLFQLYNRWGENVFATQDIKKGWDGRLKGIPQDPAVFIYIVRVKEKGEVKIYKGIFVLIR